MLSSLALVLALTDLASSNKGSFFDQDEWLQEVEEHEWKPDMNEK